DQAAFAGEDATFSVVGTGTPPLSYQWSLNQASVTGATNTTLVLANVQAINAGIYTVTITNAAGSKVSAPATLRLLPPPLIQPVTLTAGMLNLNFVVEAGHNYSVQFLDSLPAGTWQTLTNIAAPLAATHIAVSDPIS